jgi:hypothetical protein
MVGGRGKIQVLCSMVSRGQLEGCWGNQVKFLGRENNEWVKGREGEGAEGRSVEMEGRVKV